MRGKGILWLMIQLQYPYFISFFGELGAFTCSWHLCYTCVNKRYGKDVLGMLLGQFYAGGVFNNILGYAILYTCLMNLIGFMMMGIDKNRAKRGKWRIPEARLFAFSLLGGSLGTWAGMYLFRHKTKHWYFVIGMPMIFLLHIGFLVWWTGKFTGIWTNVLWKQMWK